MHKGVPFVLDALEPVMGDQEPPLCQNPGCRLQQEVQGLVWRVNEDLTTVDRSNGSILLRLSLDRFNEAFQARNGVKVRLTNLLALRLGLLFSKLWIIAKSNLRRLRTVKESVCNSLDRPAGDPNLVSVDLMDVIIEKDVSIPATVVTGKVVGKDS